MNEVFNRYAQALLEIAKDEKKVEEYREEISTIFKIINDNQDFVKVLSSEIIDYEDKVKLIEKIFNSFDKNIVSFINIILDNHRIVYLKKILRETWYLFDDYLSIERGTVYSVNLLDENEIKNIEDAIKKNVNKRCELKNIIDPSLIGGIKVVLKNDVYDASIKTQLINLKESLLKGGK